MSVLNCRLRVSRKIRSICDAHGILLIFDEVITGFGRLGEPFAADYFGIVPDLIAMAKGLTNGMCRCLPSLRVGMSTTPSWGPPHDRAVPRIYLFGASTGLCSDDGTLDVFAERPFNNGKAMALVWKMRSMDSRVCPASSISATWV